MLLARLEPSTESVALDVVLHAAQPAVRALHQAALRHAITRQWRGRVLPRLLVQRPQRRQVGELVEVVLVTPDARFGAGAFALMVAHVLYIAAFLETGSLDLGLEIMAGLLIVGIGLGAVPNILAGAREHGPITHGGVLVFAFLAGVMAALAAATSEATAALGGALVLASDALLGWNRFVAPAPGGRALVLDMTAHDRADFQQTMGHVHAGFARAGLETLASSAGLQLQRHQALPADPDARGPGLFIATLTRRPRSAC